MVLERGEYLKSYYAAMWWADNDLRNPSEIKDDSFLKNMVTDDLRTQRDVILGITNKTMDLYPIFSLAKSTNVNAIRSELQAIFREKTGGRLILFDPEFPKSPAYNPPFAILIKELLSEDTASGVTSKWQAIKQRIESATSQLDPQTRATQLNMADEYIKNLAGYENKLDPFHSPSAPPPSTPPKTPSQPQRGDPTTLLDANGIPFTRIKDESEMKHDLVLYYINSSRFRIQYTGDKYDIAISESIMAELKDLVLRTKGDLEGCKGKLKQAEAYKQNAVTLNANYGKVVKDRDSQLEKISKNLVGINLNTKGQSAPDIKRVLDGLKKSVDEARKSDKKKIIGSSATGKQTVPNFMKDMSEANAYGINETMLEYRVQ